MAEAARDRRVAHVELTDGLLVAMGGLLLLVPGLVTDVAGLLLLLPPTRSLVRRRMVREAEQPRAGAAHRPDPRRRHGRGRRGGRRADRGRPDRPVLPARPALRAAVSIEGQDRRR